MTFKLPEDLTKVSPEDLTQLHADAIDAYGPLADVDELTDEQLDELDVLANGIDAIKAQMAANTQAAAERQARIDSARERLAAASETPAEEPEAPAEETPAEEPAAETPEAEQPLDVVIPDDASELVGTEEKEPVVAAGGKESVVARAAGKIAEPAAPAEPEETFAPKFSLIAAGDVRGFSAGQEMTFDDLGEAFARKVAGIPNENRKGGRSTFSLAEMTLNTPDEYTIKSTDGPQVASDKIKAAIFAKYGANTPFGGEAESLVAAGDWGAPSQIIYDIPIIEQAPDGLLNLPSVTVERGGFQHTLGIDFSVITGDSNFGFTQTESQAAAKTAKPFISPTNPSFIDERLKVIGYGMEAGILTIKGYPELIKRYTQGTATAFAHYRNKDTITRMLSYFPIDASAIAATAYGSIIHDTLDMLTFYAERTRYKYSLKNTQTFEVALPMWTLDAFREDLAKRQGWDSLNVPDSYIENLFTQRKLSVNWLKDWTGQDLSTSATAYPATAQVLMWLPGTFVKGGGPVVSYDAVVDYQHISTNTIVQLFREESTLVAQMLNVAPLKFTIPIGTKSERDGRVGHDDYGSTSTGLTYTA